MFVFAAMEVSAEDGKVQRTKKKYKNEISKNKIK